MIDDHTDTADTTTVDFVASHHPALEAGTYAVTVSQTIGAQTILGYEVLRATTFETAQRFTVAGERFSVKPADIYAVFPPEGSLGDHATVLPHIVFTRSTLPWEQTADPSHTSAAPPETHVPWLALLLLHETESLGGMITRQQFLDAFGDAQRGVVAWEHLLQPAIGWLRPLPDHPEAAALLVTKSRRETQTLDADFAGAVQQIETILDRRRGPQVIALKDLQARLSGPLHWPGLSYDPKQYAASDQVTVIDVDQELLVSLLPTARELQLLTHVRRAPASAGAPAEGDLAVTIGNRLPLEQGMSIAHLVSVEGRYTGGRFDLDGAQKGDQIRLISLKSWRFACVDPAGDFAGLLQRLDHDPGTLRLPRDQPVLEHYLAPGFVPAPHLRADGARTAGWYRGPLITHPTAAAPALPAESATSLIHTDKDLGMQDVSYAAAWELGRLLTLQSKQVSVSLYRWKRANTQQLRQIEDQLLHPRWTGKDDAAETDGLPPPLVAWFNDLRRLRGVPFTYLVPDARMLPPESIRFFQVDHAWVDCLLDGAFSIGRVTGRIKPTDEQQKQALDQHIGAAVQMSGFLIRSSVVVGWPGLLVDGLDAAGENLDLLRFERLSPGVLLCLFKGELSAATVHQRPEALHFGFHGGGTAALQKKLRDQNGHESIPIDPISWRDADRRILDIAGLADHFPGTQPPGAAEFAVGMIEGVQRVRFNGATVRS